MPISKTKNYLVLNHNSSPVAIKTKHDSFIVEGGTVDAPGTLPLSIDEISVVNSNSNAFKIGLLRFEGNVEAEIYQELRIVNWEDILTYEQIEEIVKHPTMENLQRIIDIDSDSYFERIRGVYMGLKNSGVDISGKVDRVMELRRREFIDKQRKSAIQLTPSDSQNSVPTPSQEEFDTLKAQLAVMQAMIESLAKVKPEEEQIADSAPDTGPKKSTKSTAKK